jgi:hypothetical protein
VAILANDENGESQGQHSDCRTESTGPHGFFLLRSKLTIILKARFSVFRGTAKCFAKTKVILRARSS